MNVLSPLSTDERFTKLTDDQRRLAHFLASGRTDESFLTAQTSLEDVAGAIKKLCNDLGIRGHNYVDRRAAVVALSQELFKMRYSHTVRTEKSVPMASDAEPPTSAHEAAEELGGHVVSAVSDTDLPQTVDFDLLADRIQQLKPREREILEALAEAEWGKLEGAAFKVGLKLGSIKVYSVRLYDLLQLSHIKKITKRREFMREGLRRLKLREQAAQEPPAVRESLQPVVLPPEPEVSPLPVSAPMPPAPAKTNGVEHHPAPLDAPPDIVGAPAGYGIALPLPPTTVNVDVFSTVFSPQTEPAGIKEAIGERRDRGLVPKFLVLIPTGDPNVAQAHIVSIEEKK